MNMYTATIRKSLAAVATCAALFVSPALSAQDTPEPTEGEIELAEMLEGRVAGEAQSCIRLRPNTQVKMIDRTALVYEVGSTLYVNIPRNARSVDEDDTLVRRTISPTRLCNVEIITTIDRFNGFYTGNISLGDFIPYHKAES